MNATDPTWSVETRVAGVTFEGRQEVLERVAVGDWLRALPDPGNPYDPNAVELYRVDAHGLAIEQVGFVPRLLAVLVSHIIAGGFEVWAHVVACTGGGGEGMSRGLTVRLRRRKRGA